MYGSSQAEQFVSRRMRREGSSLSTVSTTNNLRNYEGSGDGLLAHGFPSHPNMVGGRLAPGLSGAPAHHPPTLVNVHIPGAGDVHQMSNLDEQNPNGILGKLRQRFRQHDHSNISYGHDVREALDRAAKFGPHVQVWQLNNFLITDSY